MFTSYPRIIYESKFWTHEISTRKNFGPTKYQREKVSALQNTHEKNFWTHEIATRKNLGPTKYPREKTQKYPQEKISDPPRHDDTRPMRPAIAQNPHKLAHSILL